MARDDDVQGALDMMVDALEDYANSGGIGYDAVEAAADIQAFTGYAMDGLLEEMGLL